MTTGSGFNIIKYISDAITGPYDAGEARAVARTIAEEAFHISMVQAYSGTAHPFSEAEQMQLQTFVDRLRRGEPLQYLLGTQNFCGHTFRVTPDVLIPRPETEELIPLTLQALSGCEAPTVLDAGTGSGCIALTLKLEMPAAKVWALDVSEAALSVARQNARQLRAGVSFVRADLLRPDTLPAVELDALVSNPPYVMESERQAMDARVEAFEPQQALFVPDDDPLLFYRALALWGQRVLRRGAFALMEINSALGNETAALFEAGGYRHVEVRKDSYGKNRFVVCQK